MKLGRIFQMHLLKNLIGISLSGLLAAPAFSQNYTSFNIGTLGGPGTYATDINASGQITGNSDTGTVGQYHAFVTQANGRVMADLGALPGGNTSEGYAINATGQITGISQAPHGIGQTIMPFAFIADIGGGVRQVTEWEQSAGMGINDAGQVAGYINNPFHTGTDAFVSGPNGLNALPIGGLHGEGDKAYGINSSGQVVGAGLFNSGFHHAYITSPNHASALDLGTLGGYKSTATSVNDAGKVVGSSTTDLGLESPFHAFITDANSEMTDLGTLGGKNSEAYDINSQGVVVGWADIAIGNRQHAFITGPDGDNMRDLNELVKLENGTFLTDAQGINDRGQIIANASDGYAYLLTPVPEPETYAMLLAGLGLISFMGRRKKIA
jgi:probable HAF family extracellular repeat protein